jgi:hypothetical protein
VIEDAPKKTPIVDKKLRDIKKIPADKAEELFALSSSPDDDIL